MLDVKEHRLQQKTAFAGVTNIFIDLRVWHWRIDALMANSEQYLNLGVCPISVVKRVQTKRLEHWSHDTLVAQIYSRQKLKDIEHRLRRLLLFFQN